MLKSQGVDPAKAHGSPISGVPVAILLGLALKNNPMFRLPAALGAGIIELVLQSILMKTVCGGFCSGLTFCTKPILQLGIICVGVSAPPLPILDKRAYLVRTFS